MRFLKIVAIIKELTPKFWIFGFKVAKSCSAAGAWLPNPQLPPAAGGSALYSH